MPVAVDRDPGRELHDIQRNGNLILRDSFARAAGTADDRALVPPFLLFEKPGVGRDVRFRSGQRFQNYRATFTVLDQSTSLGRGSTRSSQVALTSERHVPGCAGSTALPTTP